MSQFRVEFVLDKSTGKYLAELYDAMRPGELMARTEALYPTQTGAVLGLVQMFKNAILEFPGMAAGKRTRKNAPIRRTGKPAVKRSARRAPAKPKKTAAKRPAPAKRKKAK